MTAMEGTSAADCQSPPSKPRLGGSDRSRGDSRVRRQAPLRTNLEWDRRTRASCPVSQLLRFGRIVGRVSVFDSERPLGVDLHDYLASARERVVVHVLRQIDKAACAELFGFRFVELVPHPEAKVA